jgi:hypothetical protein
MFISKAYFLLPRTNQDRQCTYNIILKILVVVLQCILISSKLFWQQMHSLLKHKMLQLTLKISLYMAPTCFDPFGPSSGSIHRNLAKDSLCRIISKNTSLKLLLCSGNMCYVYWVLCGAQHLKHILQLHSNNFNDEFLLTILQRL